MPRFVSFPGLRYSLDHVALVDVICPPYDVIGPAEQEMLENRSPYNAIHVEMPRADGDVYAASAERFADWIDKGVLAFDEPSLYAYEMEGTDEFGVARTSRGVFGALAIAEGGVLPHEQTTKKAKTDRLDLLRATQTNTSPIWVLTPAPLSKAIADLGTADMEATDDEGITHRLWRLDPTKSAEVTALLAEDAVLVADGHHRYEVSKNYRLERQETDGDSPAPHDFVFALCTELIEDQLAIGGIHRLFSGIDAADVLAVLERHFVLQPTAAIDKGIGQRMLDSGGLAVITADGQWIAVPTGVTIESATMDLDSSRLDVAIAEMADPTVVYQHGWKECSEAVASGEATVAVLLRPATVDQIAAVGHGGDRMPPKTTFFWPKPRTGMLFRRLAAEA